MKQIVKLQLNGLVALAAKNNISMSIADDLVDYISLVGYDPQFGARPIKRVIQRKVLNQLSKEILAGHVSPGDVIVVDEFENEVVFRKPLEEEIKQAMKN